ncbi:MAG: hypothetical protein JWN70_7080 [Planctomycetaceae bacterium]|nr:hypothetical protein [Planctomycetaceae bacterium]
MRISSTLMLGLLLAPLGSVGAAEPTKDSPRPLPITRPEMKQLIEDVKVRKPRITLPELTAEEQEQQGGRQGDNYEGRLRTHYLKGIDDGRTGGRGPGGGTPGAGGGRTGGVRGQQPQDPNMTLDNAFKVELFWIVSRANNCQYCIGHQESKLLAAGLTEDRIAALDSNWSEFKPEEQTAFAFARKFSFEPHLLSDADIDGLRKNYTDPQILEMILSMAGNNSINRWKEGVGVPQRKDEGGYSRREPAPEATATEQAADAKLPRGTYLTPTSAAYAKKISRVAPLVKDEKTGEVTQATVNQRPPLESRAVVEEKLAACKQRKSRLPLVEEAAARTILADKWKDAAPLPNWVRLLVTFPRTGVSRITTTVSSEEKGDLTPLLKAQLSWIVARQDRAWYALALTQKRLHELGQSDDQIFALDGTWKEFTPREQALFVVARQLGASPVVLTDAEVAKAVELAGPRDVVQAISYTTNRAAFNRITEAAGLPIEK